MKKSNNVYLCAAVAACIIYFVVLNYTNKNKKPSNSSGKHKVYGSMECPYTVKQLEYLDKKNVGYDFVDCDTMGCPAEINGYPTTIVFPTKEKVEGYSEDF